MGPYSATPHRATARATYLAGDRERERGLRAARCPLRRAPDQVAVGQHLDRAKVHGAARGEPEHVERRRALDRNDGREDLASTCARGGVHDAERLRRHHAARVARRARCDRVRQEHVRVVAQLGRSEEHGARGHALGDRVRCVRHRHHRARRLGVDRQRGQHAQQLALEKVGVHEGVRHVEVGQEVARRHEPDAVAVAQDEERLDQRRDVRLLDRRLVRDHHHAVLAHGRVVRELRQRHAVVRQPGLEQLVLHRAKQL
jgi:hypothetical protein